MDISMCCSSAKEMGAIISEKRGVCASKLVSWNSTKSNDTSTSMHVMGSADMRSKMCSKFVDIPEVVETHTTFWQHVTCLHKTFSKNDLS